MADDEKKDALEILEILSAVESWSFSVQTRMPDHLLDRIDSAMKILRKKILEQKNEMQN